MHYKEPLKPVPRKWGVGYYGAIQVTLDGEKIQCHMCGKLFKNLSFHIRNVHFVNAKEYKSFFQLARTTALVSEAERNRLKENAMRRWQEMSPKQRQEVMRTRMEGLKKWWKENRNKDRKFGKHRLETDNKRGTCPDQLKDRLRKMAEKLGHTPSMRDFKKENNSSRWIGYINSTFGSFGKAIKAAGLVPKKKFVYKEGKKNWYSDEELLDFISIFWQENGRVATETDFHRGYIPNPQIYRRRWGTIAAARDAAGIPPDAAGRFTKGESDHEHGSARKKIKRKNPKRPSRHPALKRARYGSPANLIEINER